MAEFPALPLWTDAFIGDTHHLTPAECGAYIRLLMAAWRSPDCSLPSDDKTLGRMIGEPRQWPRLKATVLAFWELGEDGRLRQKRLLREYDFVTRKRTQARTAANAKWLKNNKPGIADASVEQVPCARASSTPTPTPKKERPPYPPEGGARANAREAEGFELEAPEPEKPKRSGKRKHQPPSYTPAFLAYYDRFRHKGAKQDALAAYNSLMASGECNHETLCGAADRYLATLKPDQPGLYARTFINRGDWREWLPKPKAPPIPDDFDPETYDWTNKPIVPSGILEKGDNRWRHRLGGWRRERHWRIGQWGEPPSSKWTDCPKHLIKAEDRLEELPKLKLVADSDQRLA